MLKIESLFGICDDGRMRKGDFSATLKKSALTFRRHTDDSRKQNHTVLFRSLPHKSYACREGGDPYLHVRWAK